MILGIGADLVKISRISKALTQFGDRLPAKLLSSRELELMPGKDSAAWLARQFAAKEAVSKALGTGMKAGVHFRQIEVLRRQSGAPYIELQGQAGQRASDLGVNQLHVSISDDRGYALAFVVAER